VYSWQFSQEHISKIVPFKDTMNLGALTNHAIEEFPTGNGPADYALVSD
jgi:hypothetical protein